MRRLHAVTLNERFLASGVYRSPGVLESWSLHQLPDQSQLIRVDRDGRAGDGRSLLIEAWRSPVGRVERFDLHAYGATDDAIQVIKAHCAVFDDYAELWQIIDAGARQEQEIALTPGCLVDPGGVALCGSLAADLSGQGAAPVLMADVTYAAPVRLQVRSMVAEVTPDQDEMIVANQPLPVQRYILDQSAFWLDERHVVIRMADTALTQYARSPEFASL